MPMSTIRVDKAGKVSVEGAIDTHLHAHPSVFPRVGDDWQIAKAAADAGMRGIVLKSHHESTVSRAYLVSQRFPSLDVFGSVTLNSYVGGINPAVVEVALRLGGKVVWMPTIDAAHHAQVFGSTGTFDSHSGGLQREEGIHALQDGKLVAEALDVLELVAQYDAILATGHLSAEEIRVLVPQAKEQGIDRIVITHPLYKASQLGVDLCQEMISLGAIMELEYNGISPKGTWEGQDLQGTVEFIKAVGAQNCLLVSDAGQRFNPVPAEALRVFAHAFLKAA